METIPYMAKGWNEASNTEMGRLSWVIGWTQCDGKGPKGDERVRAGDVRIETEVV